MPLQTWEPSRVADPISGQQLADARVRAGLTQKRLAQLLRHSESAIQKWEASHVADGKEPLVRALLKEYLDDNGPAKPAPLSSYSDWALLSELGRRLEEARARELSAGPNLNSSGNELSSAFDEERTTPARGRIRGRGPRRPEGRD